MKAHERTKGWFYLWVFLFGLAMAFLILAVGWIQKGYAQSPTFSCQWSHGGELDLKEFKVSWGTTPGVHTSGTYTMPLAQYCLPPLWMTFPVALSPGTYYFVVQAVDTSGNLSVKSPEVTLVVPNAAPAGCTSLKVQVP